MQLAKYVPVTLVRPVWRTNFSIPDPKQMTETELKRRKLRRLKSTTTFSSAVQEVEKQEKSKKLELPGRDQKKTAIKVSFILDSPF